MMQRSRSRLVVVSNRLPVRMTLEDGVWSATPASGGLVQALDPVLRNRGGLWIGWPGVVTGPHDPWAPLLAEEANERGYGLVPVGLSEELVEEFYGGFANAVLWPLFHNLDDRCVFDPAYWAAYVHANGRFAAAIAEHVRDDDLIWVHDYQLIDVAAQLRKAGARHRIGFFLHIPFPALESFLKLPWRADILRALLAYDVIGFQTERDRASFLDCVTRLLPDAHMVHDEQQEKRGLIDVTIDEHHARVGTFPIGIDYRRIAAAAAGDEVTASVRRLRLDMGNRALLLGVDRLDYTKGIPRRLLAFEHLLAGAPELHERITLLQIVEPSRELVAEYQGLKTEIDRLVGSINGRFGTPGWVPIRYIYRSVGWPDLLALYRIAVVALITPLKDGMNLVAKEYCACQIDEPGALVLSEFAGAAAQLHEHAFVVNPYDVEGTGHTIGAALALGPETRAERMKAMRAVVEREDVFWWCRRFLRAFEGSVEDLPGVDAYIPDLSPSRPPSGPPSGPPPAASPAAG